LLCDKCLLLQASCPPPLPYTTLFRPRSTQLEVVRKLGRAAEYRDNEPGAHILRMSNTSALLAGRLGFAREETENILHASPMHDRSEEHTSELQSRENLVCRLLPEKKK